MFEERTAVESYRKQEKRSDPAELRGRARRRGLCRVVVVWEMILGYEVFGEASYFHSELNCLRDSFLFRETSRPSREIPLFLW